MATNGKKYQLNVVLHGLWGIETQANGIRIVTIDDEHHHHVAGAGKWNNPVQPLPQECTLEGVTPGTPADFNAKQNPTVTPSHIPKPKSPAKTDVKAVINLPYPREIHSVRRANMTGKPKFFDKLDNPPEIADVQILVYDVEDITKLKLSPLPWIPEPNPKDHPTDPDTINLHVYAQPTTAAGVPKDHVTVNYQKLSKAFGLDIKQLRTTDVPPENPGIPGLRWQSLVGLFELSGPAASPVNCAMFVFNNRGGGGV
jgi:hypothetical protein